MPQSVAPVHPSTPERLALGLTEAAEALGITRQALAAAIRRGELRSVHIGRRHLVAVAELNRALGQPDAEATS